METIKRANKAIRRSENLSLKAIREFRKQHPTTKENPYYTVGKLTFFDAKYVQIIITVCVIKEKANVLNCMLVFLFV